MIGAVEIVVGERMPVYWLNVAVVGLMIVVVVCLVAVWLAWPARKLARTARTVDPQEAPNG